MSKTSLPTPPPEAATPGPLAVETPKLDFDAVPALQLGLAKRLALGTAKAHQDVMMPRVVSKLVKGELSRSLHLKYIMSLQAIYSNLETALAAHSTHPHLAPVYNPSLLAREPSLSADCAYYTDTNDWQTESPEGQALAKDPYPALTVYTTRLRELGEASEDSRGSQSPSMLLAHAYVRYLGDLSGGQSIARALRKSYNLPPTGEGSAFYEFFLPEPDATGLPKRADLNATKEIKQTFRDGLDAIGQLMSEEERLAVIEEARYAFVLNIGLFSTFDKVLDEEEAAAQHTNVPGATKSSPALVSLAEKPRSNLFVVGGVALAIVLGSIIATRGFLAESGLA